nr:hypothetical protein [Tanacetum cinerariifolium]
GVQVDALVDALTGVEDLGEKSCSSGGGGNESRVVKCVEMSGKCWSYTYFCVTG